MLKIIINGADGKMGAVSKQTLMDHPDFSVVANLTKGDNLQQAILATNADIVVDFTNANCVYENSNIIIDSGVHAVIGTSGLLPQQIIALQQKSRGKKLGGIIVPNFSLGAILMMKFAAQAAKIFSHVEIVEYHHPQKIDAPSGTARKTAELIQKNRKTVPADSDLASRGECVDGIAIHSIRLPGLLARQDVIFGNSGETLTIVHNSIDRACFMPGLILACQQVVKLDSLYYGLEYLVDEI